MEKTTIRSLLDFQFVSNPRFSPDGRLAAFAVQKASEAENGYQTDLYLLDIETKKIRRLTAGGDAGDYLWTGQGAILFSAMREEADRRCV